LPWISKLPRLLAPMLPAAQAPVEIAAMLPLAETLSAST
jgi:hypothetical protein